MAIFNTLAGGYYGKLGQTVGQRWKNKRVLRSYVIPANPRTEKQQANRGTFKEAIMFAQLAQATNPKTNCFDTSKITLWNNRMSLARTLQKLDTSDLNKLPLYPQNFVPPIAIEASASITDYNSPEEMLIQVDCDSDLTGRTLVYLYSENETGNTPDDFALGVGQIEDENGNAWVRFNRPLWEGELPPQAYSLGNIRVCSCDDRDSAVDMAASFEAGDLVINLD